MCNWNVLLSITGNKCLTRKLTNSNTFVGIIKVFYYLKDDFKSRSKAPYLETVCLVVPIRRGFGVRTMSYCLLRQPFSLGKSLGKIERRSIFSQQQCGDLPQLLELFLTVSILFNNHNRHFRNKCDILEEADSCSCLHHNKQFLIIRQKSLFLLGYHIYS